MNKIIITWVVFCCNTSRLTAHSRDIGHKALMPDVTEPEREPVALFWQSDY